MSNLKSSDDLKFILELRGITLKDLAKKFELSKSTMTRYFNGEIKMTADFLYSVAKITDIDLYDFFKNEGDSVRKSPKRFRE